MKGRISKRTVDAFACQNGKTKEVLWDDALSGFGVKALPTGAKTYIIQYRQHGRSRTLRMGDHGRMTPEQARSQAKKLLGEIEQGVDPIEAKRKKRAVRTFKDVADEWLHLHVEAKRKGRTARGYVDLLRLHVLPAIGALRIVDVARVDVSRLHSKMRNTPGAANRTLAVVSAIWNWAARRDEVAAHENPAKGIEKYREQAKERFLTMEELARLGEALMLAETVGLTWDADEAGPNAKHLAKVDNRRTRIDPFAVAAIRLLILTGCRLNEILGLQWSQVDFERGMIFLPDSKTGAKPIYLSAAALRTFSELPRIDRNPYVVAGANGGKPRADLKRPWESLRRAAGLEGVRIHDLRHSFASVGAGASLGLPIVGKLLGHKQAATTQRYAHLDADPLKRAAETIGSTLAAAMDGSKGAPVVKLVGRTKGQ